MNISRQLRAAACMIAVVAAGCGRTEPDLMDERLAQLESLAPVLGTVKIGGKTIPGVVVTFVTKDWASALGETDENGDFSLKTLNRPGAIPGEYRVTLSYLVAADGRVLGVGPRNGMAPDPAVGTAREHLPPEVSSPERTKLTAVVPVGGLPNLTFEVDAQIEAAPHEAADKPDAVEVEKVGSPPNPEPDKPAVAPRN